LFPASGYFNESHRTNRLRRFSSWVEISNAKLPEAIAAPAVCFPITLKTAGVAVPGGQRSERPIRTHESGRKLIGCHRIA
jgi:hypothetical protein